MAELGWLGDFAKLAGGGAAGWVGRVFSERNKRRRLRRHLYKELTENYEALTLNTKPEHEATTLVSGTFKWPLRFRFYDRAISDIETFHDLSDYGALNAAFDLVKGAHDANDGTKFGRGVIARDGIEDLLAMKFLDVQLFVKESSHWLPLSFPERMNAAMIRAAERRKELNSGPS